MNRFLTILIGYTAAAAASAAILIVYELSAIVSFFGEIPPGVLLFAALMFFALTGILLLPALAVIAITEALCIRSMRAYVALGVLVLVGLAFYSRVIDLNVPGHRLSDFVVLVIMMGAGIVAGLVYWRIAGRNAGRWHENEGPS